MPIMINFSYFKIKGCIPVRYFKRRVNYLLNMLDPSVPTFIPTIWAKALVSFLYFAQGIFLSFISTIVYLYPAFPDAHTLSDFSIAILPFSFKFATAPLVQRFTVESYGRRKVWIVGSLLAASVLTYPLAFMADKQEEYRVVIGILFVLVLMVSMGDVAVDAMAIKELDDPALAGYLQAGMQPLGSIIGRTIILNCAKPGFWTFIGIQGTLCSVQTLFTAISVIGIVAALLIHAIYKERVPEEEKDDKTPEFKTILKYYTHFINPKYSLCRTALFFLFFSQGLKFFRINFGPQAIYRGFSKQRLADIESSCIILAIIVNTIFSKFMKKQSFPKYIMSFYFIELFVVSGLYFWNNFDDRVVVGTVYFMQILGYMRFLVHFSLINNFGHSRFAGLCLTTLASCSNLGNNTWLQLKAKGMFGYEQAVGGGLVLAWLIGMAVRPCLKWMEEGLPETHEHPQHQKKS